MREKRVQPTSPAMSDATNHDDGHRAAPWLRWSARIGMLAGGAIYLLIGGLALAGAFDSAQHPSGSIGAMSKLERFPLGHVMLPLLAAGLLAYVMWQLILTVLDPECTKGRWTIKRLALRFHHLWSAALHCLLVGLAAWQMFDSGGVGGQGQTQRQLVALALHFGGGRWLIGGIGAGIVGFALVQWAMACRPQKVTRMELADSVLRLPILGLLVLGYLSRGVLFALIGALLLHAAWRNDPDQAAGISGALQWLRQQSLGPWLLGTLAVGLIAFGLAQLAEARYREIRVG